jgi:hypothetical protein
MAIARGFIASGTRRTRSIWSRPLSATSAFHLDVVGQAELALKGAAGNTFEEVFLVVAAGLLACHRQQVLLGDNP